MAAKIGCTAETLRRWVRQAEREHRDAYGVEPICRQLEIAPSTYHDHRAKRTDPDLRSNRSLRDEALCAEIHRIWEENFGVHGARKVWRQLVREGYRVARPQSATQRKPTAKAKCRDQQQQA